MLAENDDPDLRMRRPQLACEANAFVRVRRRHPNVGHDDIRFLALDGRLKILELGAGFDQHDVVERLKNARNALASDKAVVGENNPDHVRASSLFPQFAPDPTECGGD